MEKRNLVKLAIEQGSFPNILYKYRTVNDYTEDIFENQQLWFSSPEDFNDPFEFKIKDKGGYDKNDIITYLVSEGVPLDDAKGLAEQYIHDQQSLISFIEKSKDNVFSKRGILCLSKIPDDILMWSHYSNDHKGFVIGLNIEEDLDFFVLPLNVSYQSGYPSISYLKEKNKIVESCVRTKFISWEYEKEVRIIKPSAGLYKFKKEALSSVIFGCRIPEKDRKNIMQWIEKYDYPNVEIYESVMSSTKYELELKKI